MAGVDPPSGGPATTARLRRADNHSPRREDRDGRCAHRAPDRGAARPRRSGRHPARGRRRAGRGLARWAEAAGTIAAAAERAREIVRAAEAEAAAARTAGWAPAQLRGMGYPRPVTPRRRAGGPVPAEPVVADEHSPAAAADG